MIFLDLMINPESLEYAEFDQPDFPCLKEAKKAKTLPDKMKAVIYGEDKAAKFARDLVSNGLIYSANRIPEISDTIVEIDNAMKWGFNLQMGPFETWDAIGPQESVERMEAEGLKVPEKVKKMLEVGSTSFYKTEKGKVLFYDFVSESYKEVVVSENIISLALLKAKDRLVKKCDSASLIDLGDGVFCLEFHTKMNTLNQEIIEFSNESLDYVDAKGIGLVIGNQAGGVPGAFSVGANLVDVDNAAKEGKYSDIEKMLERLQNVLQKARYAAFPVVAAPYGMTLGGGKCLQSTRLELHIPARSIQITSKYTNRILEKLITREHK